MILENPSVLSRPKGCIEGLERSDPPDEIKNDLGGGLKSDTKP